MSLLFSPSIYYLKAQYITSWDMYTSWYTRTDKLSSDILMEIINSNLTFYYL